MSDFLTNSKSFRTAINRGVFSYRSKRLDAVVAAIHTFIQKATRQNLDAIKSSWKIWSETDGKEYKNRGEQLDADLKIEIRSQEAIFRRVAQLDRGKDLRKVIWIPGSFPTQRWTSGRSSSFKPLPCFLGYSMGGGRVEGTSFRPPSSISCVTAIGICRCL